MDCPTLRELIIGELSIPLAITAATFITALAAMNFAVRRDRRIDTPAADERPPHKTIAGYIAISGLMTVAVQIMAMMMIAGRCGSP